MSRVSGTRRTSQQANTHGSVVYGGQDRREGGIKTDMYVLSLPGFVWFKVNGTSAARSSHQCIVANNRQLLVVGGFGANPTYTVQDDWAQGLGVFDLTALAWKDRYDADAQPYEPAPAIADWYKNGYGFSPPFPPCPSDCCWTRN